AKTCRFCMRAPAAMEASKRLRRVSMGSFPGSRRFLEARLAGRIAGYGAGARLPRIKCCTRAVGGSLAGGRAQAVPGVADLMVMPLGQVVRRIQAQRLDVEPADGAEQGVGGDHAVALRADQARLGRDQVLLRVEHVDRGALAAGRFPLYASQRDGCGTN